MDNDNSTPTDRADARFGPETPAKAPVESTQAKSAPASTQAASAAKNASSESQGQFDGDRADRLYPDTPNDAGIEAVHGVPTGGYSIQPPEGLVIDNAIMRELEPTLKKLNLSNAGAQALMPHVANFRDRLVQSQIDEHRKVASEWAREVRNDRELGGQNWGATNVLMQRAIKAGEAGRDFTSLMEDSGLGNHPTIIRFLRNVGRKLPA